MCVCVSFFFFFPVLRSASTGPSQCYLSFPTLSISHKFCYLGCSGLSHMYSEVEAFLFLLVSLKLSIEMCVYVWLGFCCCCCFAVCFCFVLALLLLLCMVSRRGGNCNEAVTLSLQGLSDLGWMQHSAAMYSIVFSTS